MTNAVVALAVWAAVAGHEALVFCSSKAGTERIALLISDAPPRNHLGHDMLDKRVDLLISLRALQVGSNLYF